MLDITNKIEIIGNIDTEPVFDHEAYGEKFYTCKVRTKRLSDTFDYIPILISERLINIDKLNIDKKIKVEGQLRSYNQINSETNRYKLILKVFVKNIDFVDDFIDDKNNIDLTGFICKAPVDRYTPMGRHICDVLLAVNRNYNKSDYIPLICWGRNANFVQTLEIGSNINIYGRLQSREYNKKINEEEIELRTAYEVSVSKVNVVDKDDED